MASGMDSSMDSGMDLSLDLGVDSRMNSNMVLDADLSFRREPRYLRSIIDLVSGRTPEI